jgi:hypothetical protein
MSSLQLDAFREGKDITTKKDIKGEKGAYFISKNEYWKAKRPILAN